MKTIDDIRVIVYPGNEENRIVSKFLSLSDKRFIHYDDESGLNNVIHSLREERIPSKEVVILKRFNGRIAQPCPCTCDAVCCGYMLVNTCFGCLYDCAYCFLNTYMNSYGIIQFINTDDIIGSLAALRKKSGTVSRVGTGEFTDSLMFDEVTGIAESIILEVKHAKSVIVEFKTKSDNILHLLDVKEKGNTVLAWSLNTQRMIDSCEKDTAALQNRLDAAAKAADQGYHLAFHFDPIILYKNSRDDYSRLIDHLFANIDPSRIAWISLGCFRYSRGLKDILFNYGSIDHLMTEEMFPSFDGKFRYLKQKRVALYREMYERISMYSKQLFVYLCMESPDVWESVFGHSYSGACDLTDSFNGHLRDTLIATSRN